MFRTLAAGLAVVGMTVLVAPSAHAQGGSNAIFLELGGNGLLYSVNYERVMPTDVSLRAGFGYMSVSAAGAGASANVSWVTIPVTVSYLGLGGGSAKFELGGGAAFTRISGEATIDLAEDFEAGAFMPLASFIAGLRIAPPGGGFNFKLAFTPFWHPDTKFVPWGGLALGVGF